MAQSNAFAEAFKGFQDLKVPNVDFNGVFSLIRRNAEALTAANQAGAEGLQKAVKRQAEIAQSNIEAALSFVKEVTGAKSPEASAQKQAQFAQKAAEELVSNTREILEIVSKSSTQAGEVLSKRFNQAISEISDITGQAAPKAKSSK